MEWDEIVQRNLKTNQINFFFGDNMPPNIDDPHQVLYVRLADSV